MAMTRATFRAAALAGALTLSACIATGPVARPDPADDAVCM